MAKGQKRHRMADERDGKKLPNRNADPSAPSAAAGSKSRVLPQIARLRQYQRIASEQGIPFCVAEHQATAMMREACITAGPSSPGHCTCNLMKGARRIRGYVEACRHIATHRGGHDYGRYPHRFRNNTSKRSRSSYVTASSTHSKTHALSNESFNAITARPCHYCGKESDPPRHHNGLDRLDSSLRVYTEESVVSCCGDCNVMKYTYSEADFLAHVQRVADANTGQNSDEEEAGVGEQALEQPGGEPAPNPFAAFEFGGAK
ncbi:hypothetical protein EMIHUDRAFT_233380 [Emiliania huxleyi CCMP1516]|uniref:Uncharacterized protein n=2 Tax=Emiliania huxleyi TaxID=2903 RepID=A0A0D3K243_EMIH1|nr:hypothetical protein EMIHUDRAFT_233380 [Emiliania huxleyi CCMP1516]EOD29828.1 hypothetical protein EMIHUDRAFT_233380 [Emiliania huxleyi CCMP1516]|eukprot:XP_005782257.1 hypothetical protein EMIHUDRAFT_233380 [Emiliania huxleyi CCMP1516]